MWTRFSGNFASGVVVRYSIYSRNDNAFTIRVAILYRKTFNLRGNDKMAGSRFVFLIAGSVLSLGIVAHSFNIGRDEVSGSGNTKEFESDSYHLKIRDRRNNPCPCKYPIPASAIVCLCSESHVTPMWNDTIEVSDSMPAVCNQTVWHYAASFFQISAAIQWSMLRADLPALPNVPKNPFAMETAAVQTLSAMLVADSEAYTKSQ